VAVLEAPAPEGSLEEAVRLELRGALLGLGVEELAAALGAPGPRVEAALEVLAARGAAVRRGTRWCQP
jgi:hypothetical protein